MSVTAAGYFPSAHFSTIVSSIGLSAVLIVGAQYITSAPHSTPSIAPEQTSAAIGDWRDTLDQIEAQAPGLPAAPGPEVTAQLLDAAQSKNLTDTVARSLLVNLSSANSQGLGADIPTQDALLQSAFNQLPAAAPAKTYTRADLTLVADTKASEHTYGNAVMLAFGHHTAAASQNVLGPVAEALDQGDGSALSGLSATAAEYAALAQELSKLAVPQTLVPLHLQVVNSLSTITSTVGDARFVVSDPLRGLQGLQQYRLQMSQTAVVLTVIAKNFNSNGILFTKDDPGSAWAVFIAPDAQ